METVKYRFPLLRGWCSCEKRCTSEAFQNQGFFKAPWRKEVATSGGVLGLKKRVRVEPYYYSSLVSMNFVFKVVEEDSTPNRPSSKVFISVSFVLEVDVKVSTPNHNTFHHLFVFYSKRSKSVFYQLILVL